MTNDRKGAQEGVTAHWGLSRFSRRDACCHRERVFRRENGTVPLAPRKGTGPCFRPSVYLQYASCRRKMDQSPARGFTLLEVILASVLMAMVLTALLSIFNIYSRLFETGGAHVRHAQLIAAIERQLTDDLQSALEDSPSPNRDPGNPAALASGIVRRFGLQGTAEMLRFDVLQTLPEDQLPLTEDLSSLRAASASVPHIPELKTVVYRFTREQEAIRPSAREEEAEFGPDDDFSAYMPLPGPGLTRWEISLETPLERMDASEALNKDSSNEANGETPTRATALNASVKRLLANTTAAAPVTWLPEVRWMAFRYFDGQTWSDHWNSLRRGSLPVAVEVKLRFHEPAEAGKKRPAKEESTGVQEEMEDSLDEISDEEDQRASVLDARAASGDSRRSTCRFLIRLPNARERPEVTSANTAFPAYGVSAEEDSAISPPKNLPGNRRPSEEPATDRFFSQEPHEGRMAENPDAAPPDQWLRTVP
jgi:prepilin-type N-terminal cleavage/methylation domain-containing protein